MFKFLNSYSSEMRIVTRKDNFVFRDRFFEMFMRELKQSNIYDVEVKTTEIIFKAPVGRFIWNGWHFLNPISAGKIRITLLGKRPKLRYTLVFNEFLVIAIVFSLGVFPAFGLDMPIGGVFFLVFLWFGFYGISRSIAVTRMENYIKSTVFKIDYPYFPIKKAKKIKDRFGILRRIGDYLKVNKTIRS